MKSSTMCWNCLPPTDGQRCRFKKRYDYTAPVLGYPGEARQIASNLIGNAIDAVAPGGRIVLRVRAAGNGRRTGIRIVVADNGAGIAPADYTKLFEPFFTTKGERDRLGTMGYAGHRPQTPRDDTRAQQHASGPQRNGICRLSASAGIGAGRGALQQQSLRQRVGCRGPARRLSLSGGRCGSPLR